MIETIVTILIVAGAVFWFVNWFRSTASGKKGCGCGGCGCKGKKLPGDNCPTES